VMSDRRGHGIAKALKARFLELVHADKPEAKFIETYNSKSNGPMLAINRQLGFKAVREPAAYQISCAQLTAHLAARQG
jgi:GNAT superfamily N-acetyltransferase